MSYANSACDPVAVAPPLSMKLDGILNQARDARGVASTLQGRMFGYPPTAQADTKSLQAVRSDSTLTTVDDLREVINDLHDSLIELNNRV